MMSRPKTLVFGLVFLGVTFVFTSSLALERTSGNLNVLLITIDTLRPDRLSCYSPKYVKTPRIDALASRGLLFTRAFAHTPNTLPSHANILLGLTPLVHGVHDNAKFRVADDFVTLAEYLKERGYATAAFIGAFPLDHRFGLAQGFDLYDDSYPTTAPNAFLPSERKAEVVVQSALQWLGNQKEKWLAWIHLWDPHAPYRPPAPFDREFAADPYSGEVAYVDRELGRVFDFLEKNDLTRKTLVVLTGDHGESLGEHGELTHTYFAYNSTIWIPLIIAGPGIKAGRAAESVCHVDIFPTICDLLEIDKPSFLQGVSLVPVLTGKKLRPRAIYFESLDPYYNRGCAPLRGFIEDEKKFMDSPLPEYYDLVADFGEEKNLVREIDSAKCRKRMEEMEKELSSGAKVADKRMVDRQTMERLRSLGYVVSSTSPEKKSYGPEDDLKTMLPLAKKLNEAIFLSDEGKKEDSIRLLKEIIEEKKEITPAYLYLYDLYRTLGEKDKALAVLEDGVKNLPQDHELMSTYGIYLVDEGSLDKGVEVLERSLGLIDFDPDVWNSLGLAYWKKGENQEAIEQYQKALSLDPKYAMAYSNLGALYFSLFTTTKSRTDYLQSIEYLKKAIELDPSLSVAYKGLGVCYRVAGRIDEAIAVWEQASKLDASDYFLFFNLGRAYLTKGNKARALENFQRYLEIKGSNLSPEEKNEIEALIQKCQEK
jgi:arylsulfatase A-like enzyme/Flp pilus assembly protein TadD